MLDCTTRIREPGLIDDLDLFKPCDLHQMRQDCISIKQKQKHGHWFANWLSEIDLRLSLILQYTLQLNSTSTNTNHWFISARQIWVNTNSCMYLHQKNCIIDLISHFSAFLLEDIINWEKSANVAEMMNEEMTSRTVKFCRESWRWVLFSWDGTF